MGKEFLKFIRISTRKNTYKIVKKKYVYKILNVKEDLNFKQY